MYTVKELISSLPTSAWQTINWREGTKGTMQIQAVALRVHWATGSSLHSTSHSRVHTGPEGWLLGERLVPVCARLNARLHDAFAHRAGIAKTRKVPDGIAVHFDWVPVHVVSADWMEYWM